MRSTQDVTGHHIQAQDGEIGHVADFIIDDETWAIRYLVIDTKNWWAGKHVLISPQWIERVSWGEMKVFVNLSRENIKRAPEYTEGALLTREYETGLHRHYNREDMSEESRLVRSGGSAVVGCHAPGRTRRLVGPVRLRLRVIAPGPPRVGRQNDKETTNDTSFNSQI